MNILHLEASTGWGGQEIRILREAQGMRQRGHEVILAVAIGGGLVAKAKEEGFTVYELNFRRSGWFFCLWQLLKIMKRHRIDLVNTHSSLDSWIGGIAARLGKRRIVRTRHLSTPIKKGWNAKWLYGRLADFVVTTCASIVPTIVEKAGKRADLCRSVATGVDPMRIRVDWDESARFRKELNAEFLVGTACFMRSWKGINDFLMAAHLLRETAGLKWVIIGGGHAETYRNRAKELKLDGIVHFTGHLESPFAALAALDAFALLSTAHEGVSQAILQAAYLQKPLIATDVGGLGEVCIDQVTGIRVRPFCARDVTQAVLALKDNADLCLRLGQEGKKRVEEQFTLTHTLDQMEAIYRDVYRNNLKNREFDKEAPQNFQA